MYKWYVLKNYKPFWNNLSISIPYLHIEDIVSKNESFSWEEITNAAIDWKFPMEQALLQTNSENKPTYLKCSDGKQNFYFYFELISNTASEYEGEFYYDCVYTLDKYMTYYFNKFHILMNNHQEVNFLRRFSDRLDYTTNSEGVVDSITFDLLKNKQFGNTLPVNDNQMIRSYIYGTNENELWKDNFIDVTIPVSVPFKNWNGEDSYEVSWDMFTKANERKRYGYIVAKSSALQTGSSTQSKDFVSHAKNTKIIIPLFNNENNEYINEIFKGLLNFDITYEQTNVVNALSSENFIGYFECDVPFSLWYGESTKNTQIELKYGSNYINGSSSPKIAFFEVPANFAPKWIIVDYKDYDKGFDGKIKYLIKNYNLWNSETEPTLLNPAYYQERCYLDDGKFISTDTSLIKYDLKNIESIDQLGLSLKAYFMFDNDLHIAYDYESYNNTMNPLWNNKYSNIRSDLGTPNGVYGSGSATYYTNNANTLTTGIDTLKTQQQIDWIKQGCNNVTDTVSGIGKTVLQGITGNIFGAVNTSLKLAGNLIKGNSQTALQHMIENKKLASSIHNIQSSANTLLSNPYVDASIENQDINGNTLFNTYANELHPWSKEIMFKYLLANGYTFNKVDKINNFYNRKYMNTIQVDTTYNLDLLVELLNTYDRTIFGNLSYHLEFLAWLSNLHRFYNTLDIINVFEPNKENYIDNIEIKQPIFPTSRIDINTLITNTNIPYINEPNAWTIIQEANPNLPSDLKDNIIISVYNNSCTIKAKDDSTKYYGNIVFVTKNLGKTIEIEIEFDCKTIEESKGSTSGGRKTLEGQLLGDSNNNITMLENPNYNTIKLLDTGETITVDDVTKYFKRLVGEEIYANGKYYSVFHNGDGENTMKDFVDGKLNLHINHTLGTIPPSDDNIFYIWGEFYTGAWFTLSSVWSNFRDSEKANLKAFYISNKNGNLVLHFNDDASMEKYTYATTTTSASITSKFGNSNMTKLRLRVNALS